MRTTEGVWLSCTPTDDYLLVSLDFEGTYEVHYLGDETADQLLYVSLATRRDLQAYNQLSGVPRKTRY